MPESVGYLVEFAAVTTATILADRYFSDKAAAIVLVVSLILLGIIHWDGLVSFRQWAVGHKAAAVFLCIVCGSIVGLLVGILLVHSPKSSDKEPTAGSSGSHQLQATGAVAPTTSADPFPQPKSTGSLPSKHQKPVSIQALAEKLPDPALTLLAEAEKQIANCQSFMRASSARNQKVALEIQQYKDNHPNDDPDLAAFASWKIRMYSNSEIKLFQESYAPKMLAVRSDLLEHVPEAADTNNDYVNLRNLAEVTGICFGFQEIVGAYKRKLAQEGKIPNEPHY